jgi:CheY-like chemotaxis protein
VNANAQQTILIVEDEPFVRDGYRLLLEDAGYRVREAGTAGDALRSVTDERPALILLDLGLPDRPGMDVVQSLAADDGTRAIPIIAITGRAVPDEKRRYLEAGCRSYHTKPVAPRDLLGLVAALLASA